MSRIQQILDKAEREGAVHRIRRAPDILGPAPVSALDAAAVFPIGAPSPSSLVPEAPTGPAVPSVRIVESGHLDPRLIAAFATDAVAAEQYRALRTRILHADTGRPTNVILVTSPSRGDGRSLTASNLSLTMAEELDRRVCLVDADLRHPYLHRLFGLPASPGLADVLVGQATLDEALATIADHQITILPAGLTTSHQAELLGTTAMRRLIDTLRTRFERVVIDAPPALPLADVGILTPLVDSVLLVVRAGVTSKPAIHDAVAAMDEVKLLGMVLNDAA
jgi:capsular exopolysaccharide synthesis family protein